MVARTAECRFNTPRADTTSPVCAAAAVKAAPDPSPETDDASAGSTEGQQRLVRAADVGVSARRIARSGLKVLSPHLMRETTSHGMMRRPLAFTLVRPAGKPGIKDDFGEQSTVNRARRVDMRLAGILYGPNSPDPPWSTSLRAARYIPFGLETAPLAAGLRAIRDGAAPPTLDCTR